MNNFSENLKKIRKDNNLSQEQLAEKLNVSRQAISKWESGLAYPEMDKIIIICNKFNINIDDLLNNDIREVKGEESAKRSLNNSLDSFLKFITDTINLFVRMNFKSKVKCLFEQLVIGLILFAIVVVLGSLLENIFYNLLLSFPSNVYMPIREILSSLYYIFTILVSICILVHVFKTRYLDYYIKVKENSLNDEDIKGDDNKERIIIKDDEEKIVIRDPKHSEYHFINGLFKLIIFGIKCFAFIIFSFFCLLLIFIFTLFICSFLIIKSKIFFGLIISLLSVGILTLIVVLFLLNFIFNRKSDKKKMICLFIISLITFGIGIGLTFIGSLDFDVIDGKMETSVYNIEMKNGLFIDYDDIEYIEKDIDNIEIEYTISKGCEPNFIYSEEHGLYFYISCSNPMILAREFITGINNEKIIFMDDTINDIKIYASKKNIETIKKNYNKFHTK